MAMTSEELRTQLSDIEPTEQTYDGIGPAEVGLLRELVGDEEPWLAARAVHALGRVDSDDARQALIEATQDARPEVRVAVAATARSVPPDVSDALLSRLLDDPDVGVRKFAVTSSSERNGLEVRARIKELRQVEPNERVRALASEKAAGL
jgi:hypothetical protein